MRLRLLVNHLHEPRAAVELAAELKAVEAVASDPLLHSEVLMLQGAALLALSTRSTTKDERREHEQAAAAALERCK